MGAGSATLASSKKTGWLPSLPSFSLPKRAATSCWNACKNTFNFIHDRFQTPAKPIAPQRAADLTHASQEKGTGGSRPRAQISSLAKVAVVFTIALYATDALLPAAAELLTGNSLGFVDSRVAQTFANTFMTAATFAAPFLSGQNPALNADYLTPPLVHKSRKLLALPTDADACFAVGTEGIPLTASSTPIWTSTGPFSAAQGSFVPNTQSNLPAGVNFRYSETQVKPQGGILFPNTLSLIVTKADAIYQVTTDGNLNVYSDPSDPFLTTIVSLGFVPSKMIILGNKLILAGPEDPSPKPVVITQSYDITNPENPVDAGKVVGNVGETIRGLTSTGNTIGILTSTRLISIDTTNNQRTEIPLSGGTALAASDSRWYVGKSGTGIVSSSVSNLAGGNTTLPLPSTQIVYGIFCQNGYCYVGAADNSLSSSYFYTIQSPADGSMNLVGTRSDTTTVVTAIASMFPKDNVIYYSTIGLSGIGIIYLADPANPIFPPSASSLLSAGPGGNFVDLGNGVLGVKSGNGLYLFTPPSFAFKGTPEGGSKGNYSVAVTGRTLNGTNIGTRNCTVVINPAITTPLRIPNLVAVANQAFRFTIPQGTIVHARGLPMRVTYRCATGNPITGWIVLDPLTQEFTGTPLARSSTNCVINVNDGPAVSPPSTATLEPFNFDVIDGPTVIQPESTFGTVGVPFSLNLTQYAQYSGPLSLTLTGYPPSFNFSNGVLSGTPTEEDLKFAPFTSTLNVQPVGVTATQPSDLSVTRTFSLGVVKPGNPVVVVTVPSKNAYARNKDSYIIPKDLCTNPTNPTVPMTYSVSGLPGWASFNQETRTIEWEPGISDKIFPDVTYPIIITCTQQLPNGQQYSTTSTLILVLTGALSLGSVLLATATPAAYAYRNRKWAYNTGIGPYKWPRTALSVVFTVSVIFTPLMVSAKVTSVPTTNCLVTKCFSSRPSISLSWKPFEYIKGEDQEFSVGQSLSFAFKTDAEKIHYFKISYIDANGEKIKSDQLPSWLKVERFSRRTKKIFATSVPDSFFKGFVIVAKNKAGLTLEKVQFNKAGVLKSIASSGSAEGPALEVDQKDDLPKAPNTNITNSGGSAVRRESYTEIGSPAGKDAKKPASFNIAAAGTSGIASPAATRSNGNTTVDIGSLPADAGNGNGSDSSLTRTPTGTP
jgi:hypothetical protein